MNRDEQDDRALALLDELIAGITLDASGDDEELRAFRQAFEDEVTVPCDGFVIGEPVSITGFDYEGNARRGLTAKCRREGGSEYLVAACDIELAHGSQGARYVAAYRKWLGLEPLPRVATSSGRRSRQHKVTPADIDLNAFVELVALSVEEGSARCRLLSGDRVITFRAKGLWDVVPGEIVVVKPQKQWSYAGRPYLSGAIESTRLAVDTLGLVPLRLEDQGTWDPEDEYWGEEGEPIEAWAEPIIALGPRSQFEMEQVLPGADPENSDSDPITDSNDLKQAGDVEAAHGMLMELCRADLRCLDAHSHLGKIEFDHSPGKAIRHYTVGLRIGELSTGDRFDGVLPWGLVDNRPFLRCMHGLGLCLWRLGRFEEAGNVFDRMLWLNPSDNQGARFLLAAVRDRAPWEARTAGA